MYRVESYFRFIGFLDIPRIFISCLSSRLFACSIFLVFARDENENNFANWKRSLLLLLRTEYKVSCFLFHILFPQHSISAIQLFWHVILRLIEVLGIFTFTLHIIKFVTMSTFMSNRHVYLSAYGNLESSVASNNFDFTDVPT